MRILIFIVTCTVIFLAVFFKTDFFVNKKENNIETKIPENKINNFQENSFQYQVQEQLKPKNLINISNKQIDDHWNLYKGYVNNVNKLNKELAQLRKDKKGDSLNYADRRRRYGFEYNGMVLHEYYFGNLSPVYNDKSLAKDLIDALTKEFGSVQEWQDDFKNAGKTRAIGWVITYIDPVNNNIINAFIQDHEVNNIASFLPIIVMDVWEHAYMIDHNASQRGDYIDAFMQNINWQVANDRYNQAIMGKVYKRY